MMRYVILCCGLLLAVPSFATEPASPAPAPPAWTVSAECEMVLLPQKAALPLIAEFSDDEKADAAWDKIQKMIGSGEATLCADLVSKGLSEQSLSSGTGEEMRYATEYQPPSLPDKMPAEHAAEALKAWPVVGSSPTAFETRKVGQTLGLTVHVVDDGKRLDADVSLEHVRFLRWDKFDNGRLASGEHLTVEQPCFHSMKSVQNLRLRKGQKALLGVHKVPDAEKMFEFFLLRLSAAQVGSK